MDDPMWRYLKLVELFVFALFVGWYIWHLQTAYFFSWIVLPAWMLASFLAHGDTPKTMGWRADNLWQASKRSGLPFSVCIAGLVLAGAALGAFHRSAQHLLAPRHVLNYMGFCLIQQVALNSYLTNRLLDALDSPIFVSAISAAIFAALHWPNPVLVPLTFIGGAIMAWLFSNERNILPLAVGQGILGMLVWWAFPVAWHHGLRVGPGFYLFHPH